MDTKDGCVSAWMLRFSVPVWILRTYLFEWILRVFVSVGILRKFFYMSIWILIMCVFMDTRDETMCLY